MSFTVAELQALVITLGFIKIVQDTRPSFSSREVSDLKGTHKFIYIFRLIHIYVFIFSCADSLFNDCHCQ